MKTEPAHKVLLIVIDQLRADCLHGRLAEHMQMPNLRALAADAATFHHHYSVINPCGPSRASLLTARYGMNHHAVFNGAPLAHDIPQLAGEVRKLGCEPLLLGYTDTTPDPRLFHPSDPHLASYERPAAGFNEVLEMRMGADSYPWRAHLRARGLERENYRDIYLPVSPDAARPPRSDDPTAYRAQDSDTAFLTDQSIHHLALRRDKPWLAAVTYIRPHPPIAAPFPYNKMYRGNHLPAPVPAAAAHEKTNPITHRAIAAMQRSLTASEFADNGVVVQSAQEEQTVRAVYMGLASEVDHHVGRLIDSLRTSGQLDKTLVIVTADHGEMLGDHGMWGKEHVFEPAWRVPLIIRDPRCKHSRGRHIEAFTETVDITPTILDWLGAPAAPSMDGTSLLPLLSGERQSVRDYAFSELNISSPNFAALCQQQGLDATCGRLCIIREQRFKLVHFCGNMPPLLFDMQNDADERINLADESQWRDELLRLTRRLLDHRMRFQDRSLIDYRRT